MKIPKTIKVAGLDYTIKYDKELVREDDACGMHKSRVLEIILQDGGYAKQKIEQTFVHEVLHAIDVNYNNNSLEEGEVDRLAIGIYQVFKDNGLLK